MRTRLFCFIIILCGCMSLSAQDKSMGRIDENGVYFIAETMPEFPGGMGELMKYLSTNVQYPTEAQKNKIGGRVIVQFIVMEDGSISQETVVRGIDPLLDAEALRVVKQMPKWKPGMDRGVPVKVRYNIPVLFKYITEGTPGMSGTRQRPEFTVPVGEKVKNTSLEGLWQSCTVKMQDQEYHVSLEPVLKMLSSDGTFMNVFIGGNRTGVAIMAQGTYKKQSDQTYVETLAKSALPVFKVGSENTITLEFLNDNLVKFTFMIPGKETPWEEYWFRVPFPNISLGEK